MNFYLKAFGTFFKIGLFTIGGGYAMVPLIEEEVVKRKHWLSQEEFIDLLAVSQSVPGVLAAFIGTRKFKVSPILMIVLCGLAGFLLY